MLNPNWLAITLSLFYMIVNIIKRNDYEWFYHNSSVLSLSQGLILSTLRIDTEYDAPYALVVLIFCIISFIIEIKNIRIYKAENNMIDFEKRNRRRKKIKKIILVILPIMIIIKIIYELQNFFNII